MWNLAASNAMPPAPPVGCFVLLLIVLAVPVGAIFLGMFIWRQIIASGVRKGIEDAERARAARQVPPPLPPVVTQRAQGFPVVPVQKPAPGSDWPEIR